MVKSWKGLMGDLSFEGLGVILLDRCVCVYIWKPCRI